MMSQLHGLMGKVLPTLLLLLLSGVRAQGDKRWVWSKAVLKGNISNSSPTLFIPETVTTLAPIRTIQGIQNRQDFESNFGGPPIGDNGFVGANSLPRPQGLIDLGSFGDAFTPSDVFQEVDQTFNINNQLTHVTANTVPTSDPTPTFITSFTSPISSKATYNPSTTQAHASIRRQRAPFHPRLPLQQHQPFDRLPTSLSNGIKSEAPRNWITSSSKLTQTTIDNSLESATFQPSIPSNELSKHVNSLSSSSDEGGSSFAEDDGFQESSAFKVFRDSENNASPVAGSVPNDVLTINHEENQQSFLPPGVQSNHHLRRPGHHKRRPSGGPLRRPIHQSFRGRPRQPPNNLRREKPSYLTLLLG